MRLSSRRIFRALPATIEPVEPRLLFHTSAPVVPLPDLTVDPGAAPTAIDLSESFNAAANRTRVAFGFDVGRTVVELYEDAAPLTVANFLNYVRSDRYEGTVVHRAVNLLSGEPFVVQGGGYHSPDLNHIATDPPVVNEFRPNTVGRGTIAMAKPGDNPNGATSEWFFNLRNNADRLDNQNQGFTSFGEVVGNGMAVVDAIAALPRITQPAPAFDLDDFPVLVNPPASAQDFVDVQFIAELADVTSVTADNPGLVTPVLQGTTLTLNYAVGLGGVSNVTVIGVDRLGAPVTETFQVTVNAPPPPPAPEVIDVAVGTGAARSVAYADADGTAGTITVAGRRL
jgi:cyclophilin family peptidyl-prolyl cis-trans isomerase